MKKKEIQALTEKINGKMTAIASTEAIDRSGDSIKVKDWDFKNFKRNPVLQAGHDYHPLSTIGIAKNIRIKDNQVIFEPEFHEITSLAREVKKMYQDGFLTAWSVGFIPANEENKKHELLEVSAVAVPANAEALTSLSQKSIKNGTKTDEKKIGEFIKKGIQKKDYNCECIECGHKTISKKHCKDIKCSKCGGEMRRAERPGVGKNKKKFIHRLNKQLPKFFNRVYKKNIGQTTEIGLYKKHLGVDTKDIYINSFDIPMPLIGSYLSAHKNIFDTKPKETRRFNWDGREYPPIYADIQLNSKKRDSLLVEGISFYKKNIIYKIYPTYTGMIMEVITSTSNKEFNMKTMDEIHTWVKDNNFLKGEKFSITGEFLQLNNKTWNDLYIDEKSEKIIKRAITMINKDDFTSRGILMYGLPGNGKTLTGKIIMNEVKSSCIWITAKDFKPSIYPSKTIAMAYKLAKMLGTTIIFMEDIDNWLKGQVTDALKTEMDGLSENKRILTLLTSSEPENLPDCLLDRPGRFHDLIQYDAPNSKVRKKMITKLLNKEIKSLDEIVKKTKGYSGAYMKELIDLSLIISKEDNLTIEKAIDEALEKIELQKKLVEQIKDNKKKNDIDNKGISKKEGKIISKKNKDVINNTIEKLKYTVGALEKLLILSTDSKESKKVDTPAKAIKNDKLKVVKQKVKMTHKSQLAVRILQEINKQSSYGLYKIKK